MVHSTTINCVKHIETYVDSSSSKSPAQQDESLDAIAKLLMNDMITLESLESIKTVNQQLGALSISICNSKYSKALERCFYESIARELKHGEVLCNMAEKMWLHMHLIRGYGDDMLGS
ncbi:hypothetical protein L2E82_45518 [Cichorium intybus]|uniref:Uncharacterized protein n=1 Tax=Cichorium intybus TaxID=13427 RepID=A0ACB8ZST2_CICIN|nr:hypothetical protein L2E82_45518 [Cichorium intybus]